MASCRLFIPTPLERNGVCLGSHTVSPPAFCWARVTLLLSHTPSPVELIPPVQPLQLNQYGRGFRYQFYQRRKFQKNRNDLAKQRAESLLLSVRATCRGRVHRPVPEDPQGAASRRVRQDHQTPAGDIQRQGRHHVRQRGRHQVRPPTGTLLACSTVILP